MSGISVPGESPGTGFSAKRSKKSSDGGKLNLVSLMDIFTILVFFLMVNTGDVEILQPDERIVLPKSSNASIPISSHQILQNLFRALPQYVY